MKAGTIINSESLTEIFRPIIKKANALDPTKIQITTGQVMFSYGGVVRDIINATANQYFKNSTEPDGTDILYSIRKEVESLTGG
jgi:hypothetical protein